MEMEMELKSSADKVWGAVIDSSELFPKIFPEQFKSIEVVEGDGKTVGSIRLLKYAEGKIHGWSTSLFRIMFSIFEVEKVFGEQISSSS